MGIMEAFGEALVVEPYLPTLMGGLAVARGPLARSILPAVVEGKMKLAFAHAENGARYDLALRPTRARKAGEGWTLDGRKGRRRRRADGRPARGVGTPRRRRGSRALPRLKIRRRSRIARWTRCARPTSVFSGRGGRARWARARIALIEEVIDFATALVCAEAVGAISYANDATLEYLKTRKQFGVPIGSFQALQHRMVDISISYEQAQSMASLACASVDARRIRGEAAHRIRGEGPDRGRVPPREPGIGAAARRHGHERGAQGEPHVPPADDDCAAVRRRRPPPRAFRDVIKKEG